MIMEKVQKALGTAKQNGDSTVQLLQMLTAQLAMTARSRKSGEGITDDKAAVIIKRMIEGIKRDQQISNSSEKEANRKVEVLLKLLT